MGNNLFTPTNSGKSIIVSEITLTMYLTIFIHYRTLQIPFLISHFQNKFCIRKIKKSFTLKISVFFEFMVVFDQSFCTYER